MSLVTNLSSITTPFTRPLETNESYDYAQFGPEEGMYDTSMCQTFRSGDTSTLNEPLPPIPNYPPSKDDWDRYRAIFTHLYQVEEKPLKAVKELLEARYGFKATERMYKKRISEWKVKKNYKKGEKDAVCRSLQRRTQAGKNSHQVTIRDQPVKFQRILRHMKASAGVTAGQSSNDHLIYKDDDEVQVRTPDSAIILDDQPNLGNTHCELLPRLNLTSGPARPIFTCDDLGSAEIMCFEGVRYLEAVLPVQAQRSPSFGPGPEVRPATVRALVSMAASFSCARQYSGARRLLNRACDELKNEFRDADPTLLHVLLETVSNPYDSHSPFDVRRLFHEHVADLCAICLGVGHPITTIMRSLLGVGDRPRVVNAIYGSLLSTALEHSEIRSAHALAMQLTLYKSHLLGHLGQSKEAEKILHQALLFPRRLAQLKYGCLRKYAEVEVLFRRVLLENADEEGAETGHGVMLAALEGLAGTAERQGDLPKVIKLRWKALVICEEEIGPKAALTVHMAHLLENMLRHRGKHSEADLVRASHLLDDDTII